MAALAIVCTDTRALEPSPAQTPAKIYITFAYRLERISLVAVSL